MLVYNVTCNLFKLNIKRGLRKQIKKNMKRNYRVHHTKSRIEKTPTFSAISKLILTSEELTVIETID